MSLSRFECPCGHTEPTREQLNTHIRHHTQPDTTPKRVPAVTGWNHDDTR